MTWARVGVAGTLMRSELRVYAGVVSSALAKQGEEGETCGLGGEMAAGESGVEGEGSGVGGQGGWGFGACKQRD